jgi:dynein light intermediate chain
LQNKKDATEKRIQERKAIDDGRRKGEIEFLKYQGSHLENFLKSINSDFK